MFPTVCRKSRISHEVIVQQSQSPAIYTTLPHEVLISMTLCRTVFLPLRRATLDLQPLVHHAKKVIIQFQLPVIRISHRCTCHWVEPLPCCMHQIDSNISFSAARRLWQATSPSRYSPCGNLSPRRNETPDCVAAVRITAPVPAGSIDGIWRLCFCDGDFLQGIEVDNHGYLERCVSVGAERPNPFKSLIASPFSSRGYRAPTAMTHRARGHLNVLHLHLDKL